MPALSLQARGVESTKKGNAMKKNSTSEPVDATALVTDAWQAVGASFERFCLTAGVATLAKMMEDDAMQLCGRRYGRLDGKTAHRRGGAQFGADSPRGLLP